MSRLTRRPPVLGRALAGTQDIVFLVELFVDPTSAFMIWARHIRTGALAWTRHLPGQPVLAAARGSLYLGYGTATLQATAAATGHPHGHASSVPRPPTSPPTAAR
jgi:hypothetical protein